jgi:hypothetical protein
LAAIWLGLALYEELSNQNPAPLQSKFDCTKRTALLAKLQARQRAHTDTQFTGCKEAA